MTGFQMPSKLQCSLHVHCSVPTTTVSDLDKCLATFNDLMILCWPSKTEGARHLVTKWVGPRTRPSPTIGKGPWGGYHK